MTTQASLHRSDVRQLIAAAQQHNLGAPSLIELSWVRCSGIPQASWATNRALAGAGASLDLGWHLLEVGLGLLNWPRAMSVATHASNSYLEGAANKMAEWHGYGAGKASIADVEDTALFLVQTATAGLVVRTAWASEESVDRTKIVLNCPKGRLALESTFGFSKQRLSSSTLNMAVGGQVVELDLQQEAVGKEYDSAVATLLARLDGKFDYDAEFCQLSSIVSVIEPVIGMIAEREAGLCPL